MNVGGQFKTMTDRDIYVVITDIWVDDITSTSFDYDIGTKPVIRWQGNDEVYSPIKTSSAKVVLKVDNLTLLNDILDIYSDPNTRYYLIIFDGESSILWYGYISAQMPTVNNEGYPVFVTIEAVDNLTILKDYSVWDAKTTYINKRRETKYKSLQKPTGEYYKVPYQKYTVNWLDDTYYRFGEPYSTPLPTRHRSDPSLVQVIFSLLFERDRTAKSELVVLEYYDFDEDFTVGGLGATRVFIDTLLYADYPKNTETENIPIIEILGQACELFNARLFQWRGTYYFIQNEMYQHTTTCPYYTFTWAAATSAQPANTTNGTWTSSTFKVNVNTSTTPKIKEGSTFEFTPAVYKTQLDGVTGSFMGALSNVIWETKSTNTNAWLNPNNTQAEVIPEQGTMKLGWWVTTVYHSGGGNDDIVRRTGATVSNYPDTITRHCLMARYEASSLPSRVLNCTLVQDGPNYAPFQAILYDGSGWIWTTLTHDLEMDEWDGRWAEMNESAADSSGYDEINSVQ